MDDLSPIFWLITIITMVIIVRAIVLAREVLVTKAITTGALYGTGPLLPWRYWTIRSTAAFLANRTEQVCVELVSRMFFIPAREASRTAPQWLIWQRAHIPSYAICARKRHPAKQQLLVHSIMTGLKRALEASVAARRNISVDGAIGKATLLEEAVLDFDEFWPISECIEQLAVHVTAENEKEFSSGVASLAASGDVTAQVLLAWVVNELLERSEREQSLGRAVASALGAEPAAKYARAALQILAAYKRKKGESQVADSIENIDTFILAKEKVFLDENVDFLKRVFTKQREPVEQAVWKATEALFANNDLSSRAVEQAAIAIGGACDQLLVAGSARSGLNGIAALAAVRLTLRTLCHDLEDRTHGLEKEAPEMKAASQLAQDVCRWLMHGYAEGHVSGFVVVESMESIRDHRAADAAEAMVAFLQRGPSALDPGIAVCVAEGIEDRLYADETGVTTGERDCKERYRNELLFDAQFEPLREGWTSPASRRKREPSREKADDIRRFWQISIPLFPGRQRQEIPTWMNLRLALRRARPRRYLLGVVIE